MIKTVNQAVRRSRWFLPLSCLVLGVVVFLVSWLGGQFSGGLVSLAILVGAGLIILLLTSRSETVRGLTIQRDERLARIDLRANAVAGGVVLLTLIVAWLVELAHGRSGNPYGRLLAVSGLSYLTAQVYFRWRG